MIKLSSVVCRPSSVVCCLSSVVCRLSVKNSYLNSYLVGRRTPPKMANFATVRAPPPWLLLAISLSQKSSYKTGARTQLGVRIRRILLSRAVPYLPRSHQHRHPFGRTGGPTTKAETAARR
jgi:hypothetical protein